jgi:penicillin-binding protein 1C
MGLLEADGSSVPPEPPAGVVRAATSFAHGAEASRDEWFLRGTEPGPTGAALAPPRPRIASPQPGTIVAIDPDIPRDLQRLALEAHGVGHGGAVARWRLDDADLGAASGLRLWALVAGRHRLALVACDGRVLDEVAFEVRGGPAPVAAAASHGASSAPVPDADA